LRWRNGVFIPKPGVGLLEKMAAEQTDDDLFLKLLDRFTAQGRTVSDRKTANNYAPSMFTTDPEGKGKRKALMDAMARLVNTGKIKAQDYGRPARPHWRLERCTGKTENSK